MVSLDINKRFSVRYYLNLVLYDEENRRYYKQQEITLYRRRGKEAHWIKGYNVKDAKGCNSLIQRMMACHQMQTRARKKIRWSKVEMILWQYKHGYALLTLLTLAG